MPEESSRVILVIHNRLAHRPMKPKIFSRTAELAGRLFEEGVADGDADPPDAMRACFHRQSGS